MTLVEVLGGALLVVLGVAAFGVQVARWVGHRELAAREETPAESKGQEKALAFRGDTLTEVSRAELAGAEESVTSAAYKADERAAASEPLAVFEDRTCAACGHPDDHHFSDGCLNCPDTKRCMKFVKKTGAQKKLEAIARAPLPDAERRSLSEELRATKPDPKATVVGHRVWNEHVMYGPEKEYVLSDGRVVRWDSCAQYWYPSGARVEYGHPVVRQINQYEAELERAERLNRW